LLIDQVSLRSLNHDKCLKSMGLDRHSPSGLPLDFKIA